MLDPFLPILLRLKADGPPAERGLMRVWVFRMVAPIGLTLILALTPLAATAEPGCISVAPPALLTVNSLAQGATPQLRIVAESFSVGGPAREGRIVNSLALQGMNRSATTFSKGMEAIARYSFSRVDESPTPWQEGSPVSEVS